MAVVAFANRVPEGGWKVAAETATEKVKSAGKRFSEFKKSAPGTVITYGAGAAFVGGVVRKKMPTVGGIPTDLVLAGLSGWYAIDSNSLEAAAAALGFAARRLDDWGGEMADKLPSLGG